MADGQPWASCSPAIQWPRGSAKRGEKREEIEGITRVSSPGAGRGQRRPESEVAGGVPEVHAAGRTLLVIWCRGRDESMWLRFLKLV